MNGRFDEMQALSVEQAQKYNNYQLQQQASVEMQTQNEKLAKRQEILKLFESMELPTLPEVSEEQDFVDEMYNKNNKDREYLAQLKTTLSKLHGYFIVRFSQLSLTESELSGTISPKVTAFYQDIQKLIAGIDNDANYIDITNTNLYDNYANRYLRYINFNAQLLHLTNDFRNLVYHLRFICDDKEEECLTYKQLLSCSLTEIVDLLIDCPLQMNVDKYFVEHHMGALIREAKIDELLSFVVRYLDANFQSSIKPWDLALEADILTRLNKLNNLEVDAFKDAVMEKLIYCIKHHCTAGFEFLISFVSFDSQNIKNLLKIAIDYNEINIITSLFNQKNKFLIHFEELRFFSNRELPFNYFYEYAACHGSLDIFLCIWSQYQDVHRYKLLKCLLLAIDNDNNAIAEWLISNIPSELLHFPMEVEKCYIHLVIRAAAIKGNLKILAELSKLSVDFSRPGQDNQTLLNYLDNDRLAEIFDYPEN